MRKNKAETVRDKNHLDLDSIDEKLARESKTETLVENALAINEGRGHGFNPSTLSKFIKGFVKRDPSWFDVHKLVMLSYDDEKFDLKSKSIISLVERYVDPKDYIVRRKHRNGKSVAFTGEAADELVAKSRIEVDKKYVLKCGKVDARYYTVEYPMRKKLKHLGGKCLKDVVLETAEV